MTINRPVVLLGQAGGVTTGIDLGMVANAVRLTDAFSNVTIHGLHTENLGFGDHLSGQTASGLSLINPFNYWIFYWPRWVGCVRERERCGSLRVRCAFAAPPRPGQARPGVSCFLGGGWFGFTKE